MEGIKIVKRPMTWVTFFLLVAATGAIIILPYIAIHVSNQTAAQKADSTRDFILPHGIVQSFEICAFFARVLLVVVAASVVGSEYSWGTIRVMIGTGVSRSKLLLAKLIALTLTTVGFLVVAVAAGTLASLLVTVLGGHPLTLGTVNGAWWGDLVLMTLRTIFAVWVIVVLAFSVSSLTRSLAAGIAVGIGWPYIEQIGAALLGLIGSVGNTINNWLISTNAVALVIRSGLGPRTVERGTPGAWHAFGVLAVYCVVLLTATFVVFRRRDIASGS
jgi:ABC-type transport system involved in multi-copper enzyme maturation permease subunit